MNLPNAITLVRILMIPLILLFLLVNIPGGNMIATIIFLIASLTDGLDGHYARSMNQVTTLGKFLDPLADKLLIIATLSCLVSMNRVGVVAVILIIARELMVTGLRAIAADAGIVIAASYFGKVKTVSQIIAVTYVLLAGTITILPLWIGTVLIWIAVVFTILSGYDYFVKCKDLLR
ncbi:MAG: CDP-diacylglycerol--glycerol-3-phosphate 3-phosphatidyltransferase [Clostridiales bacterium]